MGAAQDNLPQTPPSPCSKATILDSNALRPLKRNFDKFPSSLLAFSWIHESSFFYLLPLLFLSVSLTRSLCLLLLSLCLGSNESPSLTGLNINDGGSLGFSISLSSPYFLKWMRQSKHNRTLSRPPWCQSLESRGRVWQHEQLIKSTQREIQHQKWHMKHWIFATSVASDGIGNFQLLTIFSFV